MILKQLKITGVFLCLSMMFFLPMAAAWLAYHQGVLLPSGQVNHGELIQPPISIASLALTPIDKESRWKQGKWTLVYLTDNVNSDLARRNLYYMRQIRQATGKNRERLERAIILSSSTTTNARSWLQAHYPNMGIFYISSQKMMALTAKLPKKLALEKGSLYLVDPLGNIMLFYAPNAAPKGILKDLERVLKVSQIG